MLDAINRFFKNKEFTAYELLEVLPNKAELIKRYGVPGLGSGNNYSAASYVATCLRKMKEISWRYETTKTTFRITLGRQKWDVTPGFPQYAVYHVK